MGFLLFLYGRASVRLIVAIVAVQPFADIVADYACHNGNKKRYKYCQRKSTPFCCQNGCDNGLIISEYGEGLNNYNLI